MTPSRKNSRPRSAGANIRARPGRARLKAKAGQDRALALSDECVCSFGATRVGPMIERVRLHVTTDRFLASRRGDKMWEAACDYAVLALTRLESRLRPALLGSWICATSGAGSPAAGRSPRACTRGASGGRR